MKHINEPGMPFNADTILTVYSLRLFGHFQPFFDALTSATSSKHPYSQGLMFKLIEVITF